MIRGHGGNIYQLAERLGCRPEQIDDMSSNINPLGPPPGLAEFLAGHTAAVCALPEVDSRNAEALMADLLGVAPPAILAGAGTTQFIYDMVAVLRSKKVLILGPTYADYGDACRRGGVAPSLLPATPENDFQPDLVQLDRLAAEADTVVICNPNNPTGVLIPGAVLRDLCGRHPRTRFVIDESYLGFLPSAEEESMTACGLANVIVLHSLSKLYRLPGLRIGFMTGAPEMVERFRQVRLPWSVNSLAQTAVRYVAEHAGEMDRFVERSRAYVREQRELLFSQLKTDNCLKIFPSRTTFFLVALPEEWRAPQVWERFAREGVLIRDCSNFKGLGDRFIRIAVNRPEVNRRVARMLLGLRAKVRDNPL